MIVCAKSTVTNILCFNSNGRLIVYNNGGQCQVMGGETDFNPTELQRGSQ